MRAAEQRDYCNPAGVRRYREEDAFQLDRRRCCGKDPAAFRSGCRGCRNERSGRGTRGNFWSRIARGGGNACFRAAGYGAGSGSRRGECAAVWPGAGASAGAHYGRATGGSPGGASVAATAAHEGWKTGADSSASWRGAATSSRPRPSLGACLNRKFYAHAWDTGSAEYSSKAPAVRAPAGSDHFRTSPAFPRRTSGDAACCGAPRRSAAGRPVASYRPATSRSVQADGPARRASGADAADRRHCFAAPRRTAGSKTCRTAASRPGGASLPDEGDARPAAAAAKRAASPVHGADSRATDLQRSVPARPDAIPAATYRPPHGRADGQRARSAPDHAASARGRGSPDDRTAPWTKGPPASRRRPRSRARG